MRDNQPDVEKAGQTHKYSNQELFFRCRVSVGEAREGGLLQVGDKAAAGKRIKVRLTGRIIAGK